MGELIIMNLFIIILDMLESIYKKSYIADSIARLLKNRCIKK
jgi:hypothetical protein